MIKMLLSEFGYGFFAEIALVAFTLIFIAVVVHTMTRSRNSMHKHANIPFEKDLE